MTDTISLNLPRTTGTLSGYVSRLRSEFEKIMKKSDLDGNRTRAARLHGSVVTDDTMRAGEVHLNDRMFYNADTTATP